jgi:hypothetical protein
MTQSRKNSKLVQIGRLVLLTMAALSALAAQRRISPLHARAEFSRSRPTDVWSAFVRSDDGTRAYKLYFHPERNVKGSLVAVDLVLNDLGHLSPDSNLLSPSGNWHGLQPYDFVASDFLQGPDKSTFGAHRKIEVKRGGLVVGINVLEVKVTSSREGDAQIGDLTLELVVDNLEP